MSNKLNDTSCDNDNNSFLEPIKDTKEVKHENESKESLIKTSLKQKINNQTVIFLSTVISQTGFDQQKYFIDFGSVKINTRKRWNIILQCNIVKIINWQLTQEKTILEKKFTKDGNEFVQNHTLDIDAFSINYTHGKVNPNREKNIVLSFFPTAVGKYYKKIIINIGKHKILINIEGYGISSKIVSFTSDTKHIQINKDDTQNNNKYIMLNEEDSFFKGK